MAQSVGGQSGEVEIPSRSINSRNSFDGKFVILMFSGVRALGDFCQSLQLITYLSKKTNNSVPLFMTHVDRPYKQPLASLCSSAQNQMMIPGVVGSPVPIEWFDIMNFNPHGGPDGFYQTLFPFPDLLVTPYMMVKAIVTRALPYVRTLIFPEDLDAKYRRKLAAMGLDSQRWLACVFARGQNYRFRPGVDINRSVKDETYFNAACHIIDELGGQVVRLGDSSMKPWPEKKGLLDLARFDEQDPLLQAAAVRNARFVLSADSGPAALANVFGTPVITADLIAKYPVGFNSWSIGLSKRVVPGPGQDLAAIADKAPRHEWWPNPEVDTILDTSFEDMRAAMAQMMETTQACEKWRDTFAPDTEIVAEDGLSLPLPPVEQNINFLKPPWWQLLAEEYG